MPAPTSTRVRPSVRRTKGYWLYLENRKKFLCQFANDMGFDPLDPEQWRSVTCAQLIERKVTYRIVSLIDLGLAHQGAGLLKTYNRSLKTALEKTLDIKLQGMRYSRMYPLLTIFAQQTSRSQGDTGTISTEGKCSSSSRRRWDSIPQIQPLGVT